MLQVHIQLFSAFFFPNIAPNVTVYSVHLRAHLSNGWSAPEMLRDADNSPLIWPVRADTCDLTFWAGENTQIYKKYPSRLQKAAYLHLPKLT